MKSPTIKVINVSEEKVTVFIYTNYNSDLKGVWSLAGSLIKTNPQRYTTTKHIGFTSTNLLKSTDKKFLKQKFYLQLGFNNKGDNDWLRRKEEGKI